MMTQRSFSLASLLLLVMASLFFLPSCVPQQRVAEMEETLAYYKTESLAADSIRHANERLATENNQTQADMQMLTQRMEQLTATNISLNNNYQDLVARYNALVGKTQEVLATSSYETTTLQQELAARQSELDQKARRLEEMEFTLRDRENQLRRLESRSTSPSPYDSPEGGDPLLVALQSRKADFDQRLANLEARLQEVLIGFPENEASISRREGKVIVTLSQPLLFPQSNEQVHWKGRQALQQVSLVLRENPDVPVEVRGHTYATNNEAYDWQLSAVRALAVTRDLITYGASGEQLLAAGKGASQPVVPNSNSQATILNSRTEIIFQPEVAPLLEAIGQ
jgi:outer membrane protein OmpA-like peptidoglycan-associated protein